MDDPGPSSQSDCSQPHPVEPNVVNVTINNQPPKLWWLIVLQAVLPSAVVIVIWILLFGPEAFIGPNP